MKEIALWGSIVVLTTAVGALWLKSPASFAVVDLNLLLSQKAQDLAKEGLVTPQQIREVSEKLREELNDLAERRGVTVFAKSSVFGGQLPDLTTELEAKK